MIDLLNKLYGNNISLWTIGQELELSFAEQPSASLITELKDNKSELLAILSENTIHSKEAFILFIESYGAKNTANIEAIFPATSLQQGFVFHHLNRPNDTAYRVQKRLTYNAKLNYKNYKKAWYEASKRYPALRIAFDWEGDVVQIITREPSIGENHFRYFDFSGLSEQDQQVKIDSIQQQDLNTPFDLSKPGLIRLVVIKQTEKHYTVLFTEHHSISDGWSSMVLRQSVHQYYDTIQAGTPIHYQPDRAYIDALTYIQNQQEKVEAFWHDAKKTWKQTNDLTPLFSYRKKNTHKKSSGQVSYETLVLKGEAYKELKLACGNFGITTNVALQFAWHKVIQVYTGDSQTIVGTIVSGRNIPVDGIESSVGLFINTLPLVINWSDDTSVCDILHSVQIEIANLNTFSSIALSKLQSEGERLFQSLFTFENYPGTIKSYPDTIENSEDCESIAHYATLESAVESTDYPVAITVSDYSGQLSISLNYDEFFIDPSQAKILLNQLATVLSQLADKGSDFHTEITLTDIPGYGYGYGYGYGIDTASPVVSHTHTIHTLFESQVAKTPDSIALVSGQAEFTFLELNEKANQIARLIRQEHAFSEGGTFPPNSIVAFYVSRGVDSIISILAILKSGAAYLPLSVEDPDERVVFQLNDSRATMLLTQTHLNAKVETYLDALERKVLKGKTLEGKIKVVTVDTPLKFSEFSKDNLPGDRCTAQDLAYVIYTSGSTGKPKGVLIEHGSVVNLAYSLQKLNLWRGGRLWGAASSFSFDASVQGISQLLLGCPMGLVSHEEKSDPVMLKQCLINNAYSVIECTPSIVEQWLGAGLGSVLPNLIIGGEPIGPVLWQALLDWQSEFGRRALNVYGPTEACVNTTYSFIDDTQPNIGIPIENVNVYVLDRLGNPLPRGAIGELHIAGAGLSRGYLNLPKLTSTYFAMGKKGPIKGERYYKSGDLVRWLPSGELEFIGRIDRQVKVRGYRIELGEIEFALAKQKGIKQAAVVHTKIAGSSRLIAYVVRRSDENTPCAEQLIKALEAVLPAYMLPSTVVVLERLPLTANGKLDESLLPDPDEPVERSLDSEPSTALESQICEIWRQVLGRKKVGVQDNFFSIGGDSILSIQLISKMRLAGLNVHIKDIFAAPTVRQIIELCSVVKSAPTIHAEKGELTGDFPLLSIQKIFFDKNFPSPQHWNQAFTITIPKDTEIQRVQTALKKLASHHDMLRCRFKKSDGVFVQSYQKELPESQYCIESLNVYGLTEIDVQNRLTQWQSQFDYIHGPLWKCILITGFDGYAKLFFAFHHLIIDAVSWRILVDDIKSLLTGKALPEKTSSYRQWVSVLEQYTKKEIEETKYWQRVLEDFPPLSENISSTLLLDDFSLSPIATAQLIEEANKGFNTEVNDLLLSALSLALKTIFGRGNIPILLEGHGREPIDKHIDVSRTLGWFTTVYPVGLLALKDVSETIIANKENLRAVPNKGIGFGAFASTKGPLENSVIPKIKFNYLGQFNTQKENSERLWELSGSNCGRQVALDNKEALILNINGVIQHGALRVSVVSGLSESGTQRFITGYKNALNKVIATCLESAKAGGIQTVSDKIGSSIVPKLAGNYEVKGHYIIQAWWRDMGYGRTSVVATTPNLVISEPYSEQLLRETVDSVVSQNAILRAIPFRREKEIWFSVSDECQPELVIYDFTGYANPFPKLLTLKDTLSNIDYITGGKPSEELDHPLAKITVAVCQNKFYVNFSVDHMIFDGFSSSILTEEFRSTYARLSKGLSQNMIERNFDYPEYLDWLSNSYQKSKLEQEDQQFWNSQRNKYKPARLTHDKLNTLNSHGVWKKVEFLLDKKSCDYIHQLSTDCQATLSNSLFTIFNHYICKKLNIDNPATGIILSGRSMPGTENIIGSLADLVFIPSVVNRHSNLEASIKETQTLVSEAMSHQRVNYRDYMPEGISPTGLDGKQRLDSSSFAFSFDSHLEYDNEQIRTLQNGPVYSEREGVELLYFIWIRFAAVGNRFIGQIEFEGEYFLEENMNAMMIEIQSYIQQCVQQCIQVKNTEQEAYCE